MLNEFVKLIIIFQFLWRSSPAILTSFDIALPEIDLFDDDGGRWASIPDVLLLPVPELLSCRA